MDVITRSDAKLLGFTHYHTGKPCKNGHIDTRLVSSSHCESCRKLYMKLYNDVNRDKLSQSKKLTYQKNKHAIAERNNQRRDIRNEYNRQYYIANKARENARATAWKGKNKSHLRRYGKLWYENNYEHVIEYNREYRANNPEQYFIRRSLDRIFSNWNGDKLEMEKVHGYTLLELRAHIELQFKEGMTWDNRHEWHIDHITPISWWLTQGVTDPSVVNALGNLQPLWASENLSKGAR